MTTTLDSLIPRPASVTVQAGSFTLTPGLGVQVTAPDPLVPAVWRALDLLPVRMTPTDGLAAIRITITAGGHPAEGYQLVVEDSSGITIDAADIAGVLAAIATLRQLLPPAVYRCRPDAETAWVLPACRIVDAPRFAWRGALIDVARHFFPKHELMRHIDALAAHKYNRLQLHLTDEQGWRVESRLFPRLTDVAASRDRTQISPWEGPKIFDEVPHGGFYTQTDLRELCDYASDRGITIIPEIELPGHTGALLAAYPEFGSPRVAKREMVGTFGLHDTVLAPTEETFVFIEAMLGEIMDIFPSPEIHIGADESVLDPWETDPHVQAYAKARGLVGKQAIFADFVDRVGTIVSARGRTMVTWDDSFATQEHAPATSATQSNTVVMAWRGEDVARRAAALGHPVVMAPLVPAYFNYDESNTPDEPMSAGGPVGIEDIVAWSPVPSNWSPDEARNMVGIQCQFFTEFCNSPRKMDYFLWPRCAAFADVAWSGKPITSEAMRDRLAMHLPRLEAMGLEFRPLAGPHPWQKGGTGREAHKPARPIAQVVQSHAEATERGDIPHDLSVNRTIPAEAS